MLKVMTIVGTRPEIIKLSRVIAELEKHVHHILVHTGQNFDYELNEIFFRDLNIRKPDYFLNAARANVAETIGYTIIEADKVLEKENPDAVLIYGDTNSCLSIIAAKRRKIPIFHMEAGNRCFDQRVPEEINRKIVDHISDINLTLSEHARRYLIAEGLRPETIFKVGSSMQEVLNHCMPEIKASTVLEELQLTPKNYILVSAHREENVDVPAHLIKLLKTFNAVIETYDKDLIVSTHPRTRLRLDELSRLGQAPAMHPRIRFLKPFGFLAYMKLQMEAFCILSDSGSLTEDATLLDLPGVIIRESHERPEGMDVTTAVMSGLEPGRILESIRLVTMQRKTERRSQARVPDYEVDNVSEKVVRLIMSYVDYIKRTVWWQVPTETAALPMHEDCCTE